MIHNLMGGSRPAEDHVCCLVGPAAEFGCSNSVSSDCAKFEMIDFWTLSLNATTLVWRGREWVDPGLDFVAGGAMSRNWTVQQTFYSRNRCCVILSCFEQMSLRGSSQGPGVEKARGPLVSR